MKGMETVDEEFLAAAKDFIQRSNKQVSHSSAGLTPGGCVSLPISTRLR